MPGAFNGWIDRGESYNSTAFYVATPRSSIRSCEIHTRMLDIHNNAPASFQLFTALFVVLVVNQSIESAFFLEQDLYYYKTMNNVDLQSSKGDEEAPDEMPSSPPAAAATSEDHVHDQLPSVEEIRMTASQRTGKTSSRLHSSRTPWIVFGVVVLVLVAIIIGLSVGLVKQEEKSREPRSAEVREWVVENGISTEADLARSEWQNAVRWIADQDEMYLPIPYARDSVEGIEFVNRYVVALIYFAMNGAGWRYKLDFLQNKDVCQWYTLFNTAGDRLFKVGASCDVPGEISQLHILGNNLKGEIPPEIRHLSKLEFLALNGNEIVGQIPESFRDLTDLYYVALHYNDLSGEIPEWLGELTKLRVLGLGENDLTGSIPQSFSNLQEMVTLGLDHNRLSGQVLMLNTMKKMKRLYLESNLFTGEVNDEFLHHLAVLEDLDLSDNQFDGTIPGHFIGHPTLEVMDLGSNALGQTIPQEFAVQDYPLTYLGLRENQFTGVIPAAALTGYVNLTHIDLSENLLTGPIPQDLQFLSKLTYLFLANNNLTPNPIPTFLGTMTNLIDLSLKDTKLTGEIPTELGKLTNLVLLDLDDNVLDGNIPSELGHLHGLLFLLLNRNSLDGSIPRQLRHLSNLEILLLDRNELTGSASPICDNMFTLSVFVADCEEDGSGEIDCECCTLCCQDSEVCFDEEYLMTLDPSWEHSFGRAFYEFSEELIFGGQEQGRRDMLPED